MSLLIDSLCIEALDPALLAGFWGGLLGWDPAEDDRGVVLAPTDDTGFRLRFLPTEQPKVAQNARHLDLTSTSLEDQRATVERVLALGGRHTDVGQGPENTHVVLADPEGNELCVIEPGNSFLAECGFVGALACDGSQEVGYFWSRALGWPLVWDQDLETAVRAPYGGPKITWGGTLPDPRIGKQRLHLDLAPPPEGDQQVEVDRLLLLGATRTDDGPGHGDRVVLADPDGHELCVLPPGAASYDDR